MSETITRAQLNELMSPLLNLAGIRESKPVSPVAFHVPLTLTTSVEVKFHGPVGVEEYDAFLAHVAFYKLLVPKEGEEKLGGGDFVGQLREIVAGIWKQRMSSPQEIDHGSE